MTDPLGLIGSTGALSREIAPKRPNAGAPGEGPDFKALLEEQIGKVSELQRDANEAIEDIATGKRDDVESVIIATQKAETAFQLLLQVRNKVLDAYEEVKQMRV